MKENKNSKPVRLVIVPFMLLTVLVLGSAILLVLFYDRYFSGFIQGNFNTYCQDYYEQFIKDKNDQEIDKNLLNYQICYNQFKKKHFIWLNMDGFSFDQLKQIKAELSKDIQIYKSVGPLYRQTGAIHETYMTGKPSLNLIGGQIAGDNIAIQIAKAQQQQKVQLLGSKFPLFTLISSYVDKWQIGDEYGILKLLCGKNSEGFDTSELFTWINRIDEFDFEKAGVHFDKEILESILDKKIPEYQSQIFKANFTDCLKTGPFLNEDLTPGKLMFYQLFLYIYGSMFDVIYVSILAHQFNLVNKIINLL